ncbi:AAA domain-containing protein [Rhizobium sp. SJZ105]|nr:AAA domain-containing protein [Rhizobium sp. SJZ105]TWC77166.1 AAA domain-containing protein [Rhizobium sp. SJZ105]
MARKKDANRLPLDSRFQFWEDSYRGRPDRWNSLLRPATGIEDGERYLLRLFSKTKTPLDQDLIGIIARAQRRVRRVMTSKVAREVLVHVIEVTEDADEIAIVMLDPGTPVAGSSHRTRTRKSRFLTSAGRAIFWRNLRRVVEGLRLIHEAGIVHGSVSEHTIFAASDDVEGYRLGGFEACIHISDGALGANDHLFDPLTAISFRQDWIDLARTAKSLLGVDDAEGPALLAIERKLLDRMGDPPRFQLFDGSVVIGELDEVITEIGRAGTSAEGELVLYPAHGVAQRDFPTLTSGTIQASEMDEVFGFVEGDLLNPSIRAKSAGQDKIRLITDVAIYDLKLQSDFTATIESAHKRQASDWLDGAVEIPHRLQLSRHRGGADERVRRLGHGAKRWNDLLSDPEASRQPHDAPTWYALVLLEAFTLLREQFRIYPVQVIASIDSQEKDLVSVRLQPDPERDERRERLGLTKALTALQKEMRYDDGKPNWTLSASEELVFSRERSPELSFDESSLIEGELTLTFTTSHLPMQGERLFLRPRRDAGTERAIRRRLLNIVAARQNLELLRALDDPAQVALDDVLREVAAPGSAVPNMDASKLSAWNSIVAGRSINVIVGPPGVGKTYLISNLVQSIMEKTPDARILVSAQNHETLVHMEKELRDILAGQASIIVRVEKSQVSVEESTLRQSSLDLLQTASQTGGSGSALIQNQSRQIAQTLRPVDNAERSLAERVLRDTDNLMLRSADVTLATTSSNTIEEMIADGEQFDWVFIEEAARANGAELIGALLLGNRRVMIGDHKQLSPFDSGERQRYYDPAAAAELLLDAQDKLAAISDLPPELDEALGTLTSDEFLLRDVLAIAARLEEPFRAIAEREDERELTTERVSSISTTLLEQSRMHPAICELVSNTFYQKKLVSSPRVTEREQKVGVTNKMPTSPIVLLDLPSLSVARRNAFEQKVKKSYKNETEANALIAALKDLKPIPGKDGRRPTLVVLSPYLAQVDHLERKLSPLINIETDTLLGFASPRGNGKFVYTSDSFQGGEADVVLATLVRNSIHVGTRALGFIKNPQRMNVLLSRARQKLILATSRKFIRNAVNGIDPDGVNEELRFLTRMLNEISLLEKKDFPQMGMGVTIVPVDENGRLAP